MKIIYSTNVFTKCEKFTYRCVKIQYPKDIFSHEHFHDTQYIYVQDYAIAILMKNFTIVVKNAYIYSNGLYF